MAELYSAVDVIRAKRDHHELTIGQIDWVVDAYTRGVVAEEQMSALAMAILLNGMNEQEIVRWTTAMINTGVRMDFSGLDRPTGQGHASAGPRGGRVRRCCAPAQRPRTGSHWRHARQDGVDPRLASPAEQ